MVYKLYKPTNITGVSGLTVGLTMIFLRPWFQTIFGLFFVSHLFDTRLACTGASNDLAIPACFAQPHQGVVQATL